MPNHRPEPSVLASIREYFRSAELFGEEVFPFPVSRPVVASPPSAAPVPLLEAASLPVGDDRRARLDALYLRYADCRRCALATSRKRIVFGMGSTAPKALFIGEGPGFEEDRQGLPFVGPAGQLLDRILKSIDLDRGQVYIANIVKCRPMKDPAQPEARGNDRPPSFEEVQACRTILDEQIEILQPPAICALGTTAAKVLLGTERGVSHLRGKAYDFKFPGSGKVVPLIPTYHPAALLRNEALKKEVWQDMKLLREILAGGK